MKTVDTVLSPNRIAVIGVGDGGCNAIASMVKQWENGPALTAINTDAQTLYANQAPQRIQIGKKLTRGLGTGGDPELGRLAAEDDFNTLRGLFTETDLVFLVTALGGGTGTGAAPVLARAAHETGALVVVLATLPFDFEGTQRTALAKKCVIELQEQADVVIAVPNQSLAATAGAAATATEAFRQADALISMGVFAIWKLLVQRGIMNVDFATLRTVARCSGGLSTFSYGEGKGPDRAFTAVESALHHPLAENTNALTEAESALISIMGGPDMTLREVEAIMASIKAFCKQDAHLTVGTTIDANWEGIISVTIVASQFWRTAEEPTTEPSLLLETEEADKPSSSGKRKKRSKPTQGQLGFDSIGKGIFKDVEPTYLNGEDLDVPTFHRRRVTIEK